MVIFPSHNWMVVCGVHVCMCTTTSYFFPLCRHHRPQSVSRREHQRHRHLKEYVLASLCLLNCKPNSFGDLLLLLSRSSQKHKQYRIFSLQEMQRILMKKVVRANLMSLQAPKSSQHRTITGSRRRRRA